MKAKELAKALGRLGGRARARRLSFERKKQIASLGGQARAQAHQVARRIAENFRYVNVARELAGRPRKVMRLKTFTGRLPGTYV